MYDVDVKRKVLCGVPLIDYIPKEVENKRIIFFLHGYSCSKTNGSFENCLQLSTRGFRVISIDAYGHGERMEKPFPQGNYKKEMENFYKLMERTAFDVKEIYSNHFQTIYPSLNLVGESMGGMLSFIIPTIVPEVYGIGSVVGSPSLLTYGYEDMIYNKCNEEEIKGTLDYLERYDAMYNLELFKNKKIYIINGKQDDFVPGKHAEEFVRQLWTRFNKQDIISYFRDCNHWSPD